MDIKDIIEKLNAYCEENATYTAEDAFENALGEEVADQIWCVAQTDYDDHRWYILALNVYRVTTDCGERYIGAWEVASLKSECMSVADCDCKISFFEMEAYTTVSYRVKE